jgi:NAD(P)H-flavin reductase
MQAYSTATAIVREMSYPQLYLRSMPSWLTPPPLGRFLVLGSYVIMVLYMLFYKSVIHDAYYWERIGFRGAWISVTQVPLVYLLASKSSVIGWIVGSSYERLNWLHRWVSRTLLLTVTIHGFFFMAEWIRADFVKLEIAMMPMVKYGLGAWGILVWTFLSSLSPLRRLAYEFFVLQHIAAAGVFLWLLYVHAPAYARYNIWFAIVAISFDWILRFCQLIYQNVRIRAAKSCNGGQRIGHQVELQASSDGITVVTIKDVHLSWKPGQHLYLWLPRLGPLESHPFTIATPYKMPNKCSCNEIQLAIRAQAGFSKRIHQYAMKSGGLLNNPLTGFIAGPYGIPPAWYAYESLVLISASTGASYTLPILESVLHSKTTICTQRIHFLLVARNRSHVEYYEERLRDAFGRAEALGIELSVEIAITSDDNSLVGSESDRNDMVQNHDFDDEKEVLEKKDGEPHVLIECLTQASSTSSRDGASQPEKCCCGDGGGPSAAASRQSVYSYSRPDIAAFIRVPVEATGGETCVAVCGGKSLVANVRNSVASLSDERAVHKGTGAQGIRLHVEEYCF